MYMQGQKKERFELLQDSFQTRQNVQWKRKYFLNSRYQRYPDIERLSVKRSFGLYGIPLEVYWDSLDDERAQAVLKIFRKGRFGITADEKCCVFCTAEYAGNKIADYMPKWLSQDGKTLSFSMLDLSLERMRACMDDILSFDPTWMRLAPSVAVMLAETMVSERLQSPQNLRYIELSGEMLDKKTERMIREAFHVKTANIYGTKETGPIAASCTQGSLHVFSENVTIQVIRNGMPVLDEEGEIYITSLHNNAMSLVRLQTGDWGELQNMTCFCGQNSQVLRLTRTRECCFIITASGRKISALVLRSLAEYANEEVSRCLSHIRFRQTNYDSMDVIISVKPAFVGWEGEFARAFCSWIRDPELKQMRWNFTYINPCASEEYEIDKEPFFTLCEGVER